MMIVLANAHFGCKSEGMKTTQLAAFLAILALPQLARAESISPPNETAATTRAAPDDYALRPSVMVGLSQWILWGGGNIAGQVKMGRWVVEYSHGQALQFDRAGGFAMTRDEREAGVSVSMPWTTGGGVGFQITPHLHALIELKAHRYEVRGYDPQQVAKYTSFSVGPGVFYDVYLYKGLFVQPNLRFWPTVLSSYDGHATFTRPDGSNYQHERHDLGVFVNVNLGWTFSG
jgi:hypothetical protein